MPDSIEQWRDTYKTFAEIVEGMDLELEMRDEYGTDDK